jgi:hypothetical protein
LTLDIRDAEYETSLQRIIQRDSGVTTSRLLSKLEIKLHPRIAIAQIVLTKSQATDAKWSVNISTG